MSKKTFVALSVFLLAIICLPTLMGANNFNAMGATAPTQIKIYVGPTNVPADNNVYDCIAVQLQDAKGVPARAAQDTEISLSSSLIKVGDLVKTSVTIPKGSTFVAAQFQSTFSPGSTSITATASGYGTVQATLNTVGPVPSSIMVYGFPATLPADGKSYEGTVVVQLQDTSGAPAKAPNEGVEVTLSSSNTAVGTVDSTVTIEGGSTFATATLTTTMTAGTTSITPVATGYTSKQATFTTKAADPNPVNLKIFLGPPKVPADSATYRQVAVEIQSTSGSVAKAAKDVTITLASSNPEVGTVEQEIRVSQGESYALADFAATYKSGTTTITATATDFKTTQDTITTVGNTPSKLAVYVVPPTLPADSQNTNTIQVQLQDSSGKPALDPNGDITVSLFSSSQDCGDVSPKQLTIPFGQTNAQGTFTSTYTANATTITAQASNYATGQAKITTSLIDSFNLNVAVKSDPVMIYPGKNSTIRATVTYEGKQLASGITMIFNSTKGGNFTKVTYEGNGTYSTIFTAPKTTKPTACNITANATKTGYTSGVGYQNITITTSGTTDPSTIGSLQIKITDGNGNKALSGATVTSTSNPTGALPLSAVTSSTGLATFTDIVVGAYTLEISKEGYDAKTQTAIVTAGKTTSVTVAISQPPSMIPIIAVIVIVAVVGGIVGFIFLRRRSRQKRFKKKAATLNLDYNQG